MAESAWTDELKQKVIDEYLQQNPTPDTSMDIVKQLAEDYDKTPNGVRMILSKAEVYVKKEPTAGKSSSTGDKPKKISKAESVAALEKAITSIGLEPDDKIIGKLTGIAAAYFAEIITKAKDK